MNLSMVQYFFEDMRDKYGEKKEHAGLFERLKIMDSGERFEDVQRYVTLKIPNQEVLYIFKNKVSNWFQEQLKKSDAVISGDTDIMQLEIKKIFIQYHQFL